MKIINFTLLITTLTFLTTGQSIINTAKQQDSVIHHLPIIAKHIKFDNDTNKYQDASYDSCYDIWTDIENNKKSSNIIIRPNPVNNKLFISIIDDNIQLRSVKIFNSTGKLVKAFHFKSSGNKNHPKTMYSCHCLDNIKINIKELPSGNYYARFQTNNGTIIKTFVKR